MAHHGEHPNDDLPPIPDHPNARRYLRILEGLRVNDLTMLQDVLDPNVVLVMEGDNRFAGTYRGVGQALALAARTRAAFAGRGIDVVEAKDEEVRAWVHVEVSKPTGESRAFRLCHIASFADDGKARRLEVSAEDQAAFDAFLKE